MAATFGWVSTPGWSRQTSSRTKIFLGCSMLLIWLYLFGLLNPIVTSRLRGTEKSLPADLEEITLNRFDHRLSTGDLFWELSPVERLSHKGFESKEEKSYEVGRLARMEADMPDRAQFEFRISSILQLKPVVPPDAPARAGSVNSPFLNPDEGDFITAVGSSHFLLLNKYCVYRPMMLLPTIEFALQTNDLDLSDFTAALAVIKSFKTKQMMIFNCGIYAGSSQGHKHMQIFPVPGYELWPGRATSHDEISAKIEGVPFKHFVSRLPDSVTASTVFGKCQSLLEETKHALKAAGQESDYNIALTTDWIALIPRSRAEWGGPFGANAQGMLGLVSVRDRAERELWGKLGYSDHLRSLGIAFDS